LVAAPREVEAITGKVNRHFARAHELAAQIAEHERAAKARHARVVVDRLLSDAQVQPAHIERARTMLVEGAPAADVFRTLAELMAADSRTEGNER
jgi:hypothetical protein